MGTNKTLDETNTYQRSSRYPKKHRTRKLVLKKDIIIPAGTVIEDVGPLRIEFGDDSRFEHFIELGSNATGTLFIGAEQNDPEFLEWFDTEGF